MIPSIKDYTIREILVESSHSMVFRALKKSDNSSVIIKMLKPESNIAPNLQQLSQEFDLLNKLNSRYIIKAYGLVPIQNSLLLVLEDFPSKNLALLIEEDTWDLLGCLDTAIQIADAVGEIHHEHIIHKDIKPQNILYDKATHNLKIIDFGVASVLTREMLNTVSPDQLQGSIHYISPEQTGRMNRALDHRSDIYSLGITLYQLFTKRLPFDSDSPLEIIHSHIAQQPAAPNERNPEIPKVLSDIILKCMSKQAENRYHSAFGLKKDLEKCRQSLLKTSDIPYFQPGAMDVYDHLHFPEKLYGRQKELGFINQCYGKIINNAFLLLVLSGYEGIGKTRLVLETQEQIAAKKGRFIIANLDQFQRNLLYNGWVQVFQNIINQMLSESDENLADWKERILEAIGENGQVITDVIPEIKLIIGESPPVTKVGPLENENRFIYTISMFLKSLLKAERPLVIFFDNVQWADELSLKLLNHFISDPNIQNLMIILSYRDNEVDAFHPLQIAIKEIVTKTDNAHFLVLKPLSQQAIEEFIHDAFFGPPKQIEQLAALTYRKSQGNPFFTIQFLKYLHDHNLLFFDKEHCCWMANLEAIAAERVSDNVADLMIENFNKLNPKMISLLKVCSAMENKFSKELISMTTEIPMKEIDQLILEALKEDLITQDKRETLRTHEATSYHFVHDRIQQAAYSLLNDIERQALHYKIGRFLLNSLSNEQLSARCIEIVNHLNLGYTSSLNEDETLELVKMNLKAGNKAKDSAAYFPAIQYFSKGISLLGKDQWELHYELAMALNSNLALCQQITGGAKQARTLFDLCLKNAKTDLEKAEIYFMSINLDSQLQNYDQVFENAAKGLKMLGYHFNLNPSKLSLIKDLVWIKIKMLFRKVENIIKMPRATNPRALAIIKIVSGTLYPAFVTGRKNLFLKNALVAVNWTLKYGIMQQSSPGFSTYAMVLGSVMLHDYEASTAFGNLATKLAQMYPKTAESSGSIYTRDAFTNRWKHPLSESIQPLRQTYRVALESGALNIAAATAVYISMIALITGQKISTVLESINENLKEVSRFKAPSEQLSLCVHREFCLALLGKTHDGTDPRPPELTDELLSPENTNKNLLYALRYDIWHVALLFLFGKYEEACGIGKNILTKTDNYPNWIEWHIFYFFHSLSLAALIKDPKKQPVEFKILTKHHKLLQGWANASPMNYAHQELLIRAEIQRLKGEHTTIIPLYEQSIEAAKKNGTTQDIAIAYELFGKYYLSQNSNEMASYFLQKAMQFFTQWGALAKCLHFRNQYVDYLSIQTFALSTLSKEDTIDERVSTRTISTSFATKSTDYIGTTTPTSDFDIRALIESSQTLSKEIYLDKLMESLMHVVIVNAGADKAFLILSEGGKLLVYSEVHLKQKYVPIFTPLKIDEKSDELCIAVVKYVARTKKEVLLNDASDEGNYRYDPYILSKKPKSILCLPLIQKGVLNGMLYLENSASKGAFTPHRTWLLSLLSSQMAISLENAQFYAKLESKVQERTKELQQRNQELQEALRIIKTVQQQMIQQEKLASIGLLTSGIAHELKNPLNFVINFSKIAQNTLKEFEEALQDNGKVEDKGELLVVLRESLAKIDTHGKRADNIIKGMLAHAHQGSAKAESVDVNALVEQSLNLTFHTYRKKDSRFNLTINRNYDPNMKPIAVFSGDLLRVFINIIDNACYALLEKIKVSPPEFSPTFNISTHYGNEYTVIKLRDNGPGIPQDIIDKVFQPFFTTKPPGTGTGLGLSIVYDVITKQHGGKIEIHSEANQSTEVIISLPSNASREESK